MPSNQPVSARVISATHASHFLWTISSKFGADQCGFAVLLDRTFHSLDLLTARRESVYRTVYRREGGRGGTGNILRFLCGGGATTIFLGGSWERLRVLQIHISTNPIRRHAYLQTYPLEKCGRCLGQLIDSSWWNVSKRCSKARAGENF